VQLMLLLTKRLTGREREHEFSIHASTLEESIMCLDYLVGLKDTHFEEMAVTYSDDGFDCYRRSLCPFGADSLEKMLQNSTRRIVFYWLIFTPDQCRTLASSGTKTDIAFLSCKFQDEGAAFVEASAARRDETSGPAKLTIVGNLPFNDRNWALFLSQRKLDFLKLCDVHLSSEVSCRAVATAEVRCLTFADECELDDEGATLVESVRQGRGPKQFCFDYLPIDPEIFLTFMNALRGNEHLERLHLILSNDEETRALAAALRENKGLVHLTVCFVSLDDSDRTELLEAISSHPSLLSLDFKMDCTDIDLKKRREFAKAVADMLSVNDRVEVMSFHNDTFDKKDWDVFVVPRLECNKYRKLFPSIQKIGEASTRAAVLARALAKFSREPLLIFMFTSKPHLVWMLLSQNHDIVSSYLDSTHDRNSIPLRKRSRSPSLDSASASN
jgi:hypothetical protein